MTRLPLLIQEKKSGCYFAVWLMKPVMWTDLLEVCSTCQYVNIRDMLSTPANSENINAVELVGL